MNKIPKKDADKILSEHTSLKAAYDKLNAHIAKLNSRVEKVIEQYNAEFGDELVALEVEIQSMSTGLSNISTSVADRMENYIADRTDKWHDSDAGMHYTYWMEDWQVYSTEIESFPDFGLFDNLHIEPIETPVLPSLPRKKDNS